MPEVWLRHGYNIRVSHFVNQNCQLRIKRTIFGSQKIISAIKQTNFGNQKVISEIKRAKFENQEIISEIKRTGQESKSIIVLMILREYTVGRQLRNKQITYRYSQHERSCS